MDDTGLAGLTLASVEPTTILPASTVVVAGSSFLGRDFGTSTLHLVGQLGGDGVDLQVPLTFVDYDRMQATDLAALPAAAFAAGATFDGEATVDVLSDVDHQVHRSPPLHVTLRLRDALSPTFATTGGDVIYVNDPIALSGDGLLLGGSEGETLAEIAGCYQASGAGTCRPVGPARVPVTPAGPFDREHGTFAFAPEIAGIEPGVFRGTVKLENGPDAASSAVEVEYTVVPPAIVGLSPARASLGEYVDFHGGGFVGADSGDGSTVIELSGSFTPEAGGDATALDVTLVPEFQSGPLARYVLSEDDELGRRVDLRHSAGQFRGSARPIVQYGGDTVRGDATDVVLDIAPVKQVVWIRFQPSYVESLRRFGLRATDGLIRDRVLAVAHRDYAGVGIEFRTEEPTDFALYSTVDIGGPDLNGLGYFGYDNTPGKDVGNQRLYDQVGGFNATTQQDGNPGYGGVFVESFFAFSKHPNGLAEPADSATPVFDAVFDPFRPDLGGAPVLARDVAAGIATRENGDGCPATGGSRADQISCAVFVLGSLIGTTMTHELGHSLGLAAPYGDPLQFHDIGDKPNRLMDSGSARTFNERAELEGEGPSVFCDEEYDYLRQILPSHDPPPPVSRPVCN